MNARIKKKKQKLEAIKMLQTFANDRKAVKEKLILKEGEGNFERKPSPDWFIRGRVCDELSYKKEETEVIKNARF